jgi:hypothetical protein
LTRGVSRPHVGGVRVRTARRGAAAVALAACVAAGCGGSGAPGDTSDAASQTSSSDTTSHMSGAPQPAFLRNLAAQCGQAFRGRLMLEPEGDPMLTGTEALLVHFRDCEAGEARIPFHIEDETSGEWNRSRTWYVMAADGGLELRHDHREADGSESRRTWYGGFTATEGTANRQDFLSPERTQAAGVTVGWRIEIEPGAFYRYGTTRAGEYDWMIEFDLARPVTGPIPAAWGADTPPTRRPGPP